MEIEARAIDRLRRYFRNVDWCLGKNMRSEDISEEILIDLFRAMGAPEFEKITLDEYQEREVAGSFERPGYINIMLKLRGGEEFYDFYFRYDVEPIKYSSSQTQEIYFSGDKLFKSFAYDPNLKVWKL